MVQVAGSAFNMGFVSSETLNLGYDFTPKIAFDIGLPLYTTRTPFSVVSKADWRYTTILGSPYLDVRYTKKYSSATLTSVLSVSGGTRSVRTYSTGRAIADWYNHLERPYEMTTIPVVVTPFVNFGAASGTFDRTVFSSLWNVSRPYQTLGGLADGEAGATFTFHKHYRLGGSYYGVAPFGKQKVFSRLVAPDSLVAAEDFEPTTGLPSHHRWWNDYYETTGAQFGSTTYGGAPSYVARDNGYTGWLEVFGHKHLSVEVGYSRSVHYEYGSTILMIKYDLSHFLRSVTTGE
jgi:hypothetical protein